MWFNFLNIYILQVFRRIVICHKSFCALQQLDISSIWTRYVFYFHNFSSSLCWKFLLRFIKVKFIFVSRLSQNPHNGFASSKKGLKFLPHHCLQSVSVCGKMLYWFCFQLTSNWLLSPTALKCWAVPHFEQAQTPSTPVHTVIGKSDSERSLAHQRFQLFVVYEAELCDKVVEMLVTGIDVSFRPQLAHTVEVMNVDMYKDPEQARQDLLRYLHEIFGKRCTLKRESQLIIHHNYS